MHIAHVGILPTHLKGPQHSALLHGLGFLKPFTALLVAGQVTVISKKTPKKSTSQPANELRLTTSVLRAGWDLICQAEGAPRSQGDRLSSGGQISQGLGTQQGLHPPWVRAGPATVPLCNIKPGLKAWLGTQTDARTPMPYPRDSPVREP